MSIRHITILNTNLINNIHDKNSYVEYGMHVNLTNYPDKIWRHHFRYEWKKALFPKKRKYVIIGDELRLMLEKNDDIQDYIDSVNKIVNRTNNLVALYDTKNKDSNHEIKHTSDLSPHIKRYRADI